MAATDSPTFFLDLDQCSLYGEDCNDLITLTQITGMSRSSIKALMHTLVNPAMLRAMRTLLVKHPNARVCIYTKKGGFITKRAMPCHMIKAGEGYIGSNITEDDMFKFEKFIIPSGMIKPYQRLFLAREVIQELLGLKSPPELIVTSVTKSVQRACLTLLDPPADPCNAFLWDDNVAIANDFHVIPVPKYNAVSPAVASLVEQQLDAMFDERKLEGRKHASAISFLRSASPDHSCFNSKTYSIFINTLKEEEENDETEWNLPELVKNDSAFAIFMVMASMTIPAQQMDSA